MKKAINERIAKARQKSEIRTRNGSLIFLAFGTTISAAMVGIELANHFQLNWFLRGLEISFIVIFAYISIDSNVRNNLLASSDDNNSKNLKDYFQKKSIGSLIATVLFSICAAYFVGQVTKGESPYKNYNNTVEVFSKRDSTNKALAAATLSDLTANQINDIKAIKKAAQAAEALLIQKFEGKPISKSWREDYRRGKSNPKHYIWICKTCPSKYRRWRNKIQETRSNAINEVANIKRSNTSIKNDLATTLTYSMEKDSSLATIKIFTASLEKERQNKSLLITFILILLTLFAALGAYNSNTNLKKLIEENGQLNEDSEELIFDVMEDFFQNLLRQFLGLIFGVLIAIDKTLEKVGIDLYEINKKSIAKWNNETDQRDQIEIKQPRPLISAFGQNKPDQPETLGGQQLPSDQPLNDQLVGIGRTVDQPTARPIGQAKTQPTTNATNAPEKVIEKQTKIIVNNVNVTRLQSDCKKYYKRSFFPSMDYNYKQRNINNPPPPETLERNKKTHLEKVEELKELGLNVRYIGEGKDRTVEFI